MQTRLIEIDGVRTRCLMADSNNSAPLLLLHGHDFHQKLLFTYGAPRQRRRRDLPLDGRIIVLSERAAGPLREQI